MKHQSTTWNNYNPQKTITYKNTHTKTQAIQNVKEATNHMTNAQPMAQNAKNVENEITGPVFADQRKIKEKNKLRHPTKEAVQV